MDAYYEGDKLVRLQLYPRKGVSDRTEEFYLMGDELVFAYIQDQGPKNEGKDMGQAGKELFFDNDKLIKLEDRSGEPNAHPSQEKKMVRNSATLRNLRVTRHPEEEIASCRFTVTPRTYSLLLGART